MASGNLLRQVPQFHFDYGFCMEVYHLWENVNQAVISDLLW